MGFFRFSVVFLVSILQQQIDGSDTPTGPKCPMNSYPAELTGCERSCGNAHLIVLPKGCENTQKPGCRCDNGLFAQRGTCGGSVECVKPEQCKVNCGPNKYYSSTVNGCEATCENPKLPQMCRGIPRPGCLCKKGYILSKKKKYACIKKEDCANCAIVEEGQSSPCEDPV